MEKYEVGSWTKLHSFLAFLSFRKGFPPFRSSPPFPSNSVTALEKWPYQLQHSCCSWLRDKLITQFGDNISLDRKIPYWSIQSSMFFSRQAESSLTRRNCELTHSSYLLPFFFTRARFPDKKFTPKSAWIKTKWISRQNSINHALHQTHIFFVKLQTECKTTQQLH